MNKFSSTTLKVVAAGVFAFAMAFASTASAYTFTTTLRQGSRGVAVQELQKFLNAYSSETVVATSGAGSAGKETTSFGPATRRAVIAFQKKNGLAQVGQVGPATRALLNGTSTGGGSNPVTNTNGVSRATTSPASGTLIATQANAKLLDMTFAGNYTVTNVKLMKGGISTNSALSNIYLFDGATRLTDAATVNSMGEISFNAPSGLFMVNGSKTISVMADVASGTSGQTVSVSFASAMAGTTAVTGSAEGSTFTIAANPSNMSTVSFTSSTVTPSGATLNTGSNVTLWQSSATIGNNDVFFDRVAFRQVGSAPASAFANFKLYVNGTQVASAAGLDSNGYVTFVPTSPVRLLSGTRIMRVDADVVSGASRTVQLSLRTAADAGFRDSQLGVNVTAAGLPEVATTASTIAGSTGGTITIEKDVTSPSQNVALSSNDAVLGIFKATVYGEPVKVETLTVGGTYSVTSTIRNGRLLINGTQYGSTATLVPAGTSFTTNYTIYPGTPVMIEVRGDIFDNDGTQSFVGGSTILTTIVAGSANGQKMDSLGSVDVPAANVSSNTLTVGTTAMTLSRNATYTNQTVVLPQTAYKVGSWNLVGSSIEDILLTTLSFDIDSVTNTTFSAADMTNVYAVIKSGGATVLTTSPVGTATAADNNVSVNYTLAKNASITVEFFATLGSTVTAADSVKTDLTVTGQSLTSGSSITATSADTDGQTLTAGAGSLTITADASTPTSPIVYSDNQTVRTAAFKFASVNTGYKVTDITLTIPAAGATIANTVNISSTTGSFSASMTAGATMTFSGLNWNIPANTNAVLNVDLVLGSVGFSAGTSGASLATALTDVTATSAATGVSAAATESNPAGTTFYAYAATPTITQTELSSSESLLGTGTKNVAKFAVSSNGGEISWKKLIFTVTRAISGTDTLATPTLWDADTNTQIAGTPAFTGSVEADGGTAGTITFVATNEQQINGTKNYILKVVVAGTITDGDNLNVSIAQPSSYVAPAAYATVAGTTSSFTWSDMSASSHSESTTDWSNGFGIKNLPTNTWTLSK